VPIEPEVTPSRRGETTWVLGFSDGAADIPVFPALMGGNDRPDPEALVPATSTSAFRHTDGIPQRRE
jgi:hypothetical protein